MEHDFVSTLYNMMADHMWGVYLGLFLAPFLQEDAAVISAASLSLMAMGDGAMLFFAVTAGLTASDLWKYWLGRAARSQGWAKKFAAKPAVARAEDLVRSKLGTTLMTVRFVPGTRIPMYIAAGYFGASWPRFVLWIVLSAIAYVGIAFALFHAVGMVAGEAARIWLPAVAIGALLIYLLYRGVRARVGSPAKE